MESSVKLFECALGTGSIVRLANAQGAWVELSSLGAGIIGLGVPNRNGLVENVALGYADPADYLHDDPCMGKTPGRFANRINSGKLNVAGKDYQLAVNCGDHHLHGGPEGFQNRLWEAELLPDGVKFSYISSDGEENYPGTLTAGVTYRWSEKNELSIEFRASADAETVVNLTNHTYWNLRGADSGTALGHLLMMKADRYLATDSGLAPTGELVTVEESPMDFRTPKSLGRDIECDFEPLRDGKGYDHCWALRGWEPGCMIEGAVTISEPESGRTLCVDTDQPGVQLYTGNWLSGSPANRSGRFYRDYDGVAVEAQGFPDAPNIPSFPSQVLKPGEEYVRRIVYRFGIL